eukprot:SAG31_NODE_259_length_18917_cov_28.559677_1_plen_121_part_00
MIEKLSSGLKLNHHIHNERHHNDGEPEVSSLAGMDPSVESPRDAQPTTGANGANAVRPAGETQDIEVSKPGWLQHMRKDCSCVQVEKFLSDYLDTLSLFLFPIGYSIMTAALFSHDEASD